MYIIGFYTSMLHGFVLSKCIPNGGRKGLTSYLKQAIDKCIEKAMRNTFSYAWIYFSVSNQEAKKLWQEKLTQLVKFDRHIIPKRNLQK